MLGRMVLARCHHGSAMLGLLLLAAAPNVQAKAIAVSPYTLEQTFGTTLRLLRVDLGLEVTERDPQAAYLLFRYQASDAPKRLVDAAIELVALDGEVRVVVKIPALPEAHERMLRDRLVRKLREDFGDPPKRKPVAKPNETPKPEEPSPPAPPGTDGAEKPRN